MNTLRENQKVTYRSEEVQAQLKNKSEIRTILTEVGFTTWRCKTITSVATYK
ncbi:hypothetical protein DPMN_073556 [Dreissena polymorpha]|uniref:Uncharacterized protein n=1 Tax=Dreissena polymorpha TaxID=45954 RepID=A0A9D4BZA4_DREPO|nr:hypothetical protein DPMN_073556 [Dreissena polymorpha]